MPGGNLRGIEKIGGAEWLKLTDPKATLQGVEAVVVDLRSDLKPEWSRFVARCVLAGLPVYDVKHVAESLTGRVEFSHLSEGSFGSVLPSNLYMPIKRGLDLAPGGDPRAARDADRDRCDGPLDPPRDAGACLLLPAPHGLPGAYLHLLEAQEHEGRGGGQTASITRRRMTPASRGLAALSASTESMSCRRSGTSSGAR